MNVCHSREMIKKSRLFSNLVKSILRCCKITFLVIVERLRQNKSTAIIVSPVKEIIASELFHF